LKAHVTTLQGQQGLAGDHTQLELPEVAGGTLQGQVTALQTQVATLQGLAGDPTQPEPPEEAGGSA
nr:hypothetical protein [Tanacetum cinerariifolium]